MAVLLYTQISTLCGITALSEFYRIKSIHKSHTIVRMRRHLQVNSHLSTNYNLTLNVFGVKFDTFLSRDRGIRAVYEQGTEDNVWTKMRANNVNMKKTS
jgi:hypothetical protein